MNETLFSQIQRLLERTYAQVGINLEDCIIDRARSVHLSKLAGASARELNEIARTFLRHAGDQLYVGIYYSRWLPATPSISIPSTVSGVLMRSANFVRSIIPPKKRTSSR